ncbi:metal ABC transporter ATP-binding protein [Pasteuria penetrans]|uniref:metal ABC transporter ATP-binding protein n=1 Tax=Pasteuria penetrans TaxID=86005 RepID=UPI0011EC43F5|nr:metal ABC transporter ATP-binding protein [Pasteuria penetrans]
MENKGNTSRQGESIPNAFPPLDLKGVSVAYHHKYVLEQVSCKMEEGTLTGIFGPNGAGKSTLLKAIVGLTPSSQGEIEIYGAPYQKQRLRVGYVPQRESVNWDFPTHVFDVVLMGRYGKCGWFRRPTPEDRDIAWNCLEKVQLQDLAKRPLQQLSGGQQQRVFLARALTQDADIYLMDEPFAGVDATTEKSIVDVLKDLRDGGKTILVVHHDLHTAREYFDTMLLLNVRMVALGDPDEILHPEILQQAYGHIQSPLTPQGVTTRRRTG